MPFSHHSHSGQFCPGHARDGLEEIVQMAIAKRMKVFALTEHMPRHDQDRYPEEVKASQTTEWMFENQAAYYNEAIRLRRKYGTQIEIPIGFEVDFCRPEAEELIERTLAAHQFDFFLGSIHHVHSIPIDYDRKMYERARTISGGTDEQLFQDYFDEQYEMLQRLKPPVVGHLDLIRLKSDEPDRALKSMAGVWERIVRNLNYIASYGGILELNFAAVRKGMMEPYPRAEICKEFMAKGGRFCLSDDSHGIDQVAHSYHTVLPFLQLAGIKSLVWLEHSTQSQTPVDGRFPSLKLNEITIEELKTLDFWSP